MYTRFFKRLFDLLIAVPLLFFMLPLMLLFGIALTISNRGKAFFFQDRPGKDGKVFRLVKFKTMNDRRDVNGNLLPDGERITPLGNLVRKTSIDELPQLLNVIAGHMSLVGPRPLLVEYLPLYSEEQARRHNVRPGITGWAQVNGRNNTEWDKRLALDTWYVDHVSFLLDLRILFKTASNVFASKDISKEGHATMPYFKGTNLV